MRNLNELSKNFFHPNNPIIKSEIPHAFFSPYSIFVALFSKITNLNAIQSLECFAFFNLIFFLISYHLFCKTFFKDNYIIVAPLSLFFILVFWGEGPFMWSGFFHIMVLNYVLPYPSTFTIALVFMILFIILKNQTKNSPVFKIVSIILSSIVIITHPTTAIFLFVSVITLNLTYNQLSIKKSIIQSLLVIIPSAVLCLLWPYFNFLDLLTGNNYDFHKDSKTLYYGLITKNWPLIFIIPGFSYIKVDKTICFFVITIILLSLIYIIGYLTKIYGISRVISHIMIIAHLFTAYTLVLLIKQSRIYSKLYLITLSVALAISISLNHRPLYRTLKNTIRKKNIEYYSKFNFLTNIVNSNDVIISDNYSNEFIPSFNGKVISTINPLYWINDIEERRDAVNLFFIKDSPNSLRQLIIDKYNPDYILIDSNEVNFDFITFQWLKSIGHTVYKKNKIELIKIDP